MKCSFSNDCALPGFNLIIRTTALLEEADAVICYTQASPESGVRFSAALESILHKIARNPQHFGFVDADRHFRDVAVPAFRFFVVFSTEENTVVIHAIRHTARRPFASD